MTQLGSLITVTGKVANIEGRERKHRPPCAAGYPVHHFKERPGHPSLHPGGDNIYYHPIFVSLEKKIKE